MLAVGPRPTHHSELRKSSSRPASATSPGRVPAASRLFGAGDLQELNIQSFDDYATKVPNVSFTYGTGPTGISEARTVAIRGITGQNIIGSSGATGFYIDDTPIPGSVDPRVVDIDNIEVLKGPQGTLVRRKFAGRQRAPDHQAARSEYRRIRLHGASGFNVGRRQRRRRRQLVGNHGADAGTLAMRVVLFANHDAGYLTRTFPSPTSPAVDGSFPHRTARLRRQSGRANDLRWFVGSAVQGDR